MPTVHCCITSIKLTAIHINGETFSKLNPRRTLCQKPKADIQECNVYKFCTGVVCVRRFRLMQTLLISHFTSVLLFFYNVD